MTTVDVDKMISEAQTSFNNASKLASQRRFPEAIEQYKDAIKLLYELNAMSLFFEKTPQDLVNNVNQNLYFGFVDIGNCYLDLNKPNFNEASRSFLNALRYDQKPDTVGNLLYCVEHINAFMSSTIITYKKEELDDNFVNLYNQGFDLLKTNSISEAANTLNEAIKIHPNFAPGYHLLGLVFEKKKQDELVVKSWLKVLNLNKDFNFETRIKIQLS